MNLFASIPRPAWLLVAASAVLQVMIFPFAGPVPAARAALSWMALSPFLAALLLVRSDGHPLRISQGAALGYACGILWYLGNCYWIYQTMYQYGGLPKPIAVGILLLFALYLGLYHAVFAALFSLVGRSHFGRGGSLLLTPFLWVAVELARSRITGFPWDLLGNSQVDNLLLTRLAPVAGVLSMSFVLAAINTAVLALFFFTGRKRIWIPATAVLFAIALEAAGRAGADAVPQSAPQTAVMMQENLAVGAEAQGIAPESANQEAEIFSAWSLRPELPFRNGHVSISWLRSSQPIHPTIEIWPEAPSHFRSDDPNFRSGIAQFARAANAPAIIGSLGLDFTNESPRGYYEYDSASLFDAAGTYHGRYDKIHLVPWGEYVPFKRFFAFAKKLTEGVGDMDPGTQRSVFTTGGHTYGVFVCYESVFGDEVRHFAENGAQVLVNISDDGWYGDSGAPWQHLNMTRMRAIENHRWLLLDTNTGITTAIDPLGRTEFEAPRHVRAAFAFPFAFTQGTTFYTRHGDWFAWLCAIVTLIAVVLSATTRPRAVS
jgi:apolipoprotein N-acyltransferase